MEKVIVATPEELSQLIESSLKKIFKENLEATPTGDDLPELLNISQASKLLNLAKQTLYGFTSKGEIPYLKKGKKLYFKKTELLKWINAGKMI